MKKIIFLALTLCITTAPSLFAQGNGHTSGKTKTTTTVRTHTTVHHAKTTGVANARRHGGKAYAKGHYKHVRHTTRVTTTY